MDRRKILQAIGFTPLIAIPTRAQADTTEQQLVALIGELENAPGYEIVLTHYAKAYAAAEIRKILGLPIPDSMKLENYWRGHAEQVE